MGRERDVYGYLILGENQSRPDRHRKQARRVLLKEVSGDTLLTTLRETQNPLLLT